MAKVKFNFNTLDADTQQMYQPSDEFVEVSDAFAKRLEVHTSHGVNFEVEGADTYKADKEALKVKYFELFGVKPGNKSIETMTAEIEAKEAEGADDQGDDNQE